MFVLTRLRTLVRLEPDAWTRSLPDALVDKLNASLANTVMHNVGLIVSVFDLLEIDKSFLLPGDGASHTNVTFRVVVFRPFHEEVLRGRIKSCTRAGGVHVSLGFFDDVVIPPEALQHPYRFDDAEQVWVWEYPQEDENGEETSVDLYMDPGEEIRFRVTSEVFVDTSPASKQPEKADKKSDSTSSGNLAEEEKKIPYLIMASVNEPGLGLLSWWNS